MSDQLEKLKQLQVIDGELYLLRREKKQKPILLEHAKKALSDQQAKAQEIDSSLKATQLKQKEKDMDLSTREANVRKLQGQLFQVKTNKEYSAIQHEIELGKADISLVEEEIIRLLEEVDRLNSAHKTQLSEVGKQQQALSEEEKKVAKEMEQIQQRIDELEAVRKNMTPNIPSQALSVYERVLISRDGMAMAPLIGHSCGGCNMMQPPQIISEVYLGAKLITCENCNRILYTQDEYAKS